MYIVVIEWDGRQPSTTYYNRMHSLGLFVRGGEKKSSGGYTESPLTRRAISDGSVVAQEGAVLCASESLARAVAMYAQDDGAAFVKIGTVDAKTFHASKNDIATYQRIEGVFGRRGRPTGKKSTWVITCLEEMKSFLHNEEAYAVGRCPHCSGVKINSRPGERIALKFPETGSVFDGWVRHRFAAGAFEQPQDGKTNPPKYSTVEANMKPEASKVVERIQNSPLIMNALNALPRETAARVLDAVLSARQYHTVERRQTERVKSCIYLFKRGVDSDNVSLAEQAEYDLLDAATVLGHDEAARLWLTVNN